MNEENNSWEKLLRFQTRNFLWQLADRAFSIYQKIPENSGNFGRKCLSVKDVFHYPTLVPFMTIYSQVPCTILCIPCKIQNGDTTVVVERNARLLFGRLKRISLIQMMMTFLSWRRLQPIWGAIFTEIKVLMKVFRLHIRSINLKATSEL